MSPSSLRRASLALALLAAGCGGKPATPDTAEVVTKTPPPGTVPAPESAPAQAEPSPSAPAEAKP